jgi:hypothetical protein
LISIIARFLFAKGDDCFRLDRFVAGAALGVKKAEQFLQRFRVGGVPEKGAVAAHRDQFLILELFQMMRKG